MSFTSISPREFFLGPNTNTASHLGPGTYDYLPVGDNTALLKKRLQSRNAGGFNSHEIKTSASHIPSLFTPGPGVYNLKQKSNFESQFIKSEDDPSQYFQILNGNLVRKVQQYASNTGVPKILDVVSTLGKNWQPGPGSYSPKNNLHQEVTQSVTRDQLYSIPDRHALADMQQSKMVGKNVPVKVDFFPKKKTVPSIPAKSLAPPEDKLASLNQEQYNYQPKQQPRPSYMTELEGSRNPAVSPFSYAPKVQHQNVVDQISWQKSSPRFDYSEERKKSRERSKSEGKSRSPEPQNIQNFKVQQQQLTKQKTVQSALKLKSPLKGIVVNSNQNFAETLNATTEADLNFGNQSERKKNETAFRGSDTGTRFEINKDSELDFSQGESIRVPAKMTTPLVKTQKKIKQFDIPEQKITEPIEKITEKLVGPIVEYSQLKTVNLGSTNLSTDQMPGEILKGKTVNPKDVVASRRKSPGPGEYPVVQQSMKVKQKLAGFTSFDSKTERFINSPFDAPSLTTSPNVGPGAYKDYEALQLLAQDKMKDKIKADEIENFNRLKKMFPNMTSINTVKLNQLKEYAAAHRGPGTYTIATERLDFGGHGDTLKSAFGTNDSRKLDNRTIGIIDNPAPNQYKTNPILGIKNQDQASAIFLSKGRLPNLTQSVRNPSPTTYQTQSYSTIGYAPPQGGSPNNVTTLKKAEDKILSDILFPFLVQEKMPYSTDVLTSVEIGPGKYMGQDSLGQRGSPFNPNAKRNTYNGSSAERFSDKRQLKNPGPGSYKINADSLLEKSVFTFSKRFSPSAANIYV